MVCKTMIAFGMLFLLLVSGAGAEENCGVMLFTTSRLKGVVDNVQPLAGWSGELIESGSVDPRYVVSISVLGEETNVGPVPDKVLKKGSKINFAIHSPAQYFLTGWYVRSLITLQVEKMQCDGEFRRITRVSQPNLIPEKFVGNLQVGTTYNADVASIEKNNVSFSVPINIPYHHGVCVEWTNPQELPKVGSQTVVFKVVSKEIRYVGSRQWRTTYTLTAQN